MKGYRFYLEYPDSKSKVKATCKNTGSHSGTCVALCDGKEHIYIDQRGNIMQEAFTGVFDKPDSPVCFSAVSWGYLRSNCKRISEHQAKGIHPALFERIELD
jgi:hypothetical protein